MTDTEKAIVMAYTGVAMLTGDKIDVFYRYLADLYGRPVFTHELMWMGNEIKEKSKPDFLKLCQDEKTCDQCKHRQHCIGNVIMVPRGKGVTYFPVHYCSCWERSEDAETD